MRLKGLRPTPSMAVATVALVVAASGVGAAAVHRVIHLIDGSLIKPGTITGKQIKNHSIGLNKLTGTLPRGPQGPKGDPGTPATRLFAEISPGASPTILDGAGVTGVTESAPGFYIVSFNRDVSGCAPIGTTNGTGGNNTDTTVNVVHRSGGATQLNVATFAFGSSSFEITTPFSVAVLCP